ncbi:U-scoloptoxin(01)-Er1a-like 15 [Homarus americanus]|uniref:U-scoloptoxin(01)-Er1a-like 15 n=1 Tax=Homarus americanus TaxID=6706 RepID=A0A8J5MRA2_HOMAM|nr:U-scoloptoxin(01)-Er1a-like 15 [Homarus americanus]
MSGESYIAPEAGYQVFHICQADGRSDSFLCPNGTIFNQQFFVCDWWYNFDCSTAPQFYGLNAPDRIGQQ